MGSCQGPKCAERVQLLWESLPETWTHTASAPAQDLHLSSVLSFVWELSSLPLIVIGCRTKPKLSFFHVYYKPIPSQTPLLNILE